MKNVEDIYPLSPMQQGLLFHALSDSSTGAYVERISWVLSGDLDADAFRSAWEHTVKAHPILRTSFYFEGLDEPVQVVRRQVKFPWQQQDWRDLSADEQGRRFAHLLAEERARGFKLDSAPLMRLTLLHVGPKLHRFLWSYHHLLLDGWSISLLLREVLEAYKALRHSQPPPPTASRPYRDYIGWLQRQDAEGAETFWRERLRGFNAPTMLGVERGAHAAAAPAERYRKVHRAMSVEMTAALQSLVRQHRLTLNTLVQGAWALLLSRYSGDEEVLFGSVVSGRPPSLDSAETMVGLFINTLPVRVEVPGDESLLGWLNKLQAQQAQMQQYAYCPLRQVQRWSEVRSGQPLFESVVVVRNLPIDEGLRQRGEDTEVKDLLHHEMATGHPLTFGVVPEQGLKLQLTYDSEKYEEATIQRMLGHVEHLLEEIAADPRRRLTGLVMLTADEREQLLAASDPPPRPYNLDAPAHELFRHQAERTPDAVALSFRGRHLSYSELDERASRLASRLRSRGVGAESVVGVLLERSVESVVSLLAVWKAGGAYLPLDPAHPAQRLRFILSDAGAGLLITERSLMGLLAEPSPPLLLLDEEGGGAAESEVGAASEPADVRPHDLAYVIYTSGSTGEPKGVMVEHGQLVNTLHAAQELYRFTAGDVVACLAPFSFDISLFELLSPLLAGGRVVLESARRMLEEETAAAVLAEVTFLHSAPGLMRRMAASIAARPESHRQIRAVMVGGDAVPPDLLLELRRALPEARLYVGYGPTEAAIMCAAYEVRDARALGHRMLGHPMANTRLRLYDRHGQPVPEGVTGELYIGGASVGRGYLNSEQLTREKYVEIDGERFYRSGDLGRRLSDGSIAFMGRADGQVKVRGFRVESGEVEAALESHAGVREAAVVLREDGRGGAGLVGYVVREEGGALDLGDVRRHVAGRVPEYMVPSALVEIERMPLTALAKIDRKALPAPGSLQTESGHGYVGPRTEIEEILAGIWAEMLRVERVGVHDNFFEAGGDSLSATQLISRVRETLGAQVALRELFEHPTVSELAGRVEGLLREGAGAGPGPAARAERGGESALSFAQQRLWFIDRLQPGSSLYNMPNVVRLSGRLNVAALEETLTEVVRRHEVLRTTFASAGGKPVQHVNPAQPIKLTFVDLGPMNEGEREERARQVIEEESARPFDLGRGPLLRTHLVRLAEDEHLVLFTTHHIVSDGWSLGVLIREVVAIYAAADRGEPTPLPELSIQYADFARWQNEWLKGEVAEKELEYWKRQLGGAPSVLELPTDRPRPSVQSHRGAQHSFQFTPELTRALEELSRRERATLFMTLLAAWQTLLMRHSGQSEVVVGVPIANRNYKEVEPLIGFFVNMLAMRTDFSGDPSFGELLSRVRETALGAYAHQDMPFEKLVKELQPVRSTSHSPLFQVIFVLENIDEGALQLPGLRLSPVERPGGSAIYDLSLAMSRTADGLAATLTYNTDLFEAATITRMSAHFRRLLESIVADPRRRLTGLGMLTADEREQLLAASDPPPRPYNLDAPAHELFRRQAQRTPDAVALSFQDQHLSYRELDERANRLARLLISRGVGGPARAGEPVVAVCLERSAESVVALLAIWKAGAAYLPLDIEQPARRLRALLEDAAPAAVLTEGAVLRRLGPDVLAGAEGAGRAPVVVSVDEAEALAGQKAEDPGVEVCAGALAYVIYTSGSTGEPKGVMVEHGQLVGTLLAARELHGFNPDDIVPCVSPFSFDIALFELLSPLLAGARSLLVSGRDMLDASLAKRMLKEVTFLHSATSLMRQFVRFAKEDGAGNGYPRLRQVYVGGDVVPPALVEELRATFPAARLRVCYGPTEATILCAAHAVGRDEEVTHPLVGEPLANVKLRLYDRGGNLVPVGVDGEIYIGGACVTRGYLNRDELTREKYVEIDGERFYRSGDVGRRLPDGSIAFVGRTDEQVKVHGFRIEVGEIEAALAACEGLEEVAVLARPDETGEQRLTAYVVPKNGTPPTAGRLRSHLSERLPAYMIPAEFAVLAALPRTPHGKLDRLALAGSAAARVELGGAYVAPETDAEMVIADAWREVLGLGLVGVHDNFFEVGGSSLLLVQIHHRLQQAVKSDLTMIDLFKYPTIRALAEHVGRAEPAEASFGRVYDRVKKQKEILQRERRHARGGKTTR